MEVIEQQRTAIVDLIASAHIMAVPRHTSPAATMLVEPGRIKLDKVVARSLAQTMCNEFGQRLGCRRPKPTNLATPEPSIVMASHFTIEPMGLVDEQLANAGSAAQVIGTKSKMDFSTELVMLLLVVTLQLVKSLGMFEVASYSTVDQEVELTAIEVLAASEHITVETESAEKDLDTD